MRARKSTKNVEMLAVVAKGLKHLKEKVVFVGGATIDLFVGPGAPETRATDDVDCVVDLGTRMEYYQLEGELRGLGFQHPILKGGPVCRWTFSGIQVDVMPTEGAVLGFKNRWYRDGMTHAETVTLPDGQDVLAFSPPYLLASKLEAFRNRGHGDYLTSPDIEDIVALLDGCPDIDETILKAPADVRRYLAKQAAQLLDTPDYVSSLDGHLAGGPAGKNRADRCLGIMRRISQSAPQP